MPLPFWYEQGRGWAGEVLDGLEDAGPFRPQEAIDSWLEFRLSNGFPPFDGEGEGAELAEEMARWCVSQRSARKQFADGYRDGMRETRTARKLAQAVARARRTFEAQGV